MLRKPSCGGLKKFYSVDKSLYQEVPQVLPILFIRQHPHSGQMRMSTFHTAFISSAMDRWAYLARKR